MKAQLLTTDFILGFLLMIIVLSTVVVFLPSNKAPFEQDVRRLDVLLTEGVPSQWNSSTVQAVGFLSAGRLNESKVRNFSALPLSKQRQLLNLQSSFSLKFYNGSQELLVNGLPLCSNCTNIPATYTDVYPLRRVIVYDGSIVLMEVVLYQ
jgi:hypothetical protein